MTAVNGALGLAMSLSQMRTRLADIPKHSLEECGKSDYDRAFCAAKQLRRFSDRFVRPLWDQINRALCTNSDLADPHDHDDLCQQARDLVSEIAERRVAAVREMIRLETEHPLHRKILYLHIAAAGGLPQEKIETGTVLPLITTPAAGLSAD